MGTIARSWREAEQKNSAALLSIEPDWRGQQAKSDGGKMPPLPTRYGPTDTIGQLIRSSLAGTTFALSAVSRLTTEAQAALS